MNLMQIDKSSSFGRALHSEDSYVQKKQLDVHCSLPQSAIGTKLNIESPCGLFEQEANAGTNRVTGIPERINFSGSDKFIRRKCDNCEKEEIQKKERDNQSISEAPQIVQNTLSSSSGKSLNTDTRSFMESRFNYDFSSVKIHDNDLAAKSASSINALAYTSGNSVVFNSGQYNTGSDSGKKLLAHELTHVVQQNGRTGSIIQKQDKEDSAPLDKGSDKDKPPSTAPVAVTGSCAQSSKASTYVASSLDSMGKPIKVDLDDASFGDTSKLAAFFQFGACKEKSFWRFYLDKLVVSVDSKVQPIDFRINIPSADDKSVTKDNYLKVIKDLKPDKKGKFSVSCAGNKFVDEVSSYSSRKEFWNYQFVVDHEAFHRKDWDDTYRPNLIKAEKQIWDYNLPDSAAATAKDAIAKANKDLTQFMIDAYQETCKTFTPKKELRAYDNGAPQYQKLVDEITAKAKTEKW